MRQFTDVDELAAFLATLHCEAVVRNIDGQKIGAVEWAPDLFDDRRKRWAWYFDQDGALFANWQEA